MKLKSLYCLVFTVVLLLATNCFAGDYATLNFVGFSKDGRYLAFEEYGTQDGSGFPYSNFYFIDTEKNAYAAPRIGVRIDKESATEPAARKRASSLAARKLRQFGIIRGNVGKLVVSHMMTDLTFDSVGQKPPSVIKFAEEVGSMYQRGDYELWLTQTPIKTNECEPFEMETNMLELKLTNKEDDASKFLQKDTTLPSSRGCALYYRLQDVYLYKDSVAVFVGVFTQGFEGPDMRFMAVTGKLR